MTDQETTERAARRRRILLKLEALWEARLEVDAMPLLAHVMDRYVQTFGSWQYWATDGDIEKALDAALAEEGLSVTGGWKS